MKKLLIILSLIIVLTGSVLVIYKLLPLIKIQQNQTINNIPSREELITEKPTSTDAAINDEPVKKDPVFYDILGSSKKPKIYPDAAMAEWREAVVNLARKRSSELYVNGQSENKVVALTFDDGPDPVNTPKIIKALHDNEVQGTFFCIGKQIEPCRAIIKQAYKDGNVIANHSWSHKDLTTINAAGINNEVTLAENEIYKVIGQRPALIRPPYGAINDATLNSLTALNYKSILWSIDTLDWEQREVDNIVKNVVENVRPGEIILMHCDGDKQITTKALPLIISRLKEMGYSFATVDKLLALPAYK